MRNQLLVAIIAILLFRSPSLFAQSAASQSSDIAAIRAQIDAMKSDYEKKIQDLQKQLDDIQARQSSLTGPSAAAAPATAAPQALAQTPSSSVVGGSVNNGKVFNPDISVIGDFLGATGSNQVNPSPAMEMHETEVAFQAVVDPYAKADFFISFGEEGVNLEEGY